MQVFEGQIRELRLLEGADGPAAWITCPPAAIPAPGRYVMVWRTGEEESPLAAPLFAAQIGEGGFLASPPVPAGWMPGDRLSLRGPLGWGFELPASVRRLALADLGGGVARLLPLISLALARNAAVALYSDSPAPLLPFSVEVNPLSLLPEALAWADFLALDLKLEGLTDLRSQLGLRYGESELTIPAQALIASPMPCGGIAECGVCAVLVGKRWKLVCRDGPVFDLSVLLRGL